MAEIAEENIVIAGAGPVGAVCALAMKQGGLDPLLLEARPQNMPVNDRRTLALSYGSRLILERLGVWAHIRQAFAITRIHISHKGGLGRAVLDTTEEKLPALGYVLSYGELSGALLCALEASAVRIRYGTPVEDVQPGSQGAKVQVGGEFAGTLAARLAVVADGGRGEAQPGKWFRDYGQVAVVAQVTTELPHQGTAYERFTPDGPVALLPNGAGGAYALVWVNAPEQAARIAQLDDASFLSGLQRQFGGRQGKFISVSARGQFPLKLDYHGSAAGERMVRIGNASQTLHPVAGQGFNLGLRDAWELAQSCLEIPANELGGATQLAAFSRSRQRDVLPGIGFTDFLVRAFSTSNPVAQHLRGLGLMALQALPPARHFVARRMLFGKNG
jgi:2-octaprenyl-6-methoxyphenol hydroxylase